MWWIRRRSGSYDCGPGHHHGGANDHHGGSHHDHHRRANDHHGRTTTSTTTTTTTTSTTTTTLPALPDGLVPTHGGDAVAVYLGVVEYDAVEGNPADGFADAILAAEAMGYFVGSGDLACDQGAQEALELPPDGYYWAASVLFATVDDGLAFAAAFPGDIVAILEVTTFCLD